MRKAQTPGEVLAEHLAPLPKGAKKAAAEYMKVDASWVSRILKGQRLEPEHWERFGELVGATFDEVREMDGEWASRKAASRKATTLAKKLSSARPRSEAGGPAGRSSRRRGA